MNLQNINVDPPEQNFQRTHHEQCQPRNKQVMIDGNPQTKSQECIVISLSLYSIVCEIPIEKKLFGCSLFPKLMLTFLLMSKLLLLYELKEWYAVTPGWAGLEFKLLIEQPARADLEFKLTELDINSRHIPCIDTKISSSTNAISYTNCWLISTNEMSILSTSFFFVRMREVTWPRF